MPYSHGRIDAAQLFHSPASLAVRVELLPGHDKERPDEPSRTYDELLVRYEHLGVLVCLRGDPMKLGAEMQISVENWWIWERAVDLWALSGATERISF